MAYLDGYIAFIEGLEFWQNPHSQRYMEQKDFHAWFAGWCCAKKEWT